MRVHSFVRSYSTTQGLARTHTIAVGARHCLVVVGRGRRAVNNFSPLFRLDGGVQRTSSPRDG